MGFVLKGRHPVGLTRMEVQRDGQLYNRLPLGRTKSLKRFPEAHLHLYGAARVDQEVRVRLEEGAHGGRWQNAFLENF